MINENVLWFVNYAVPRQYLALKRSIGRFFEYQAPGVSPLSDQCRRVAEAFCSRLTPNLGDPAHAKSERESDPRGEEDD